MRLFYPSNKWVFRSVAAALFLVLVVLTVIAFTPASDLTTTNTTPAPKTADLCAKFPKIQGEILCQDAVKTALEKYPGKVTKIDKKLRPIPVGKTPDAIKFEEKIVWLISIISDKEIPTPRGDMRKNLDLAIDIKEKKILNTILKLENENK